MKLRFLGLSLGLAVRVLALDSRQVGKTIQTSSGPVSGHAASNATTVSEYLGIPFAQPPIGSLRFAPPVKYTGTAPLNGSSFGYACIASGPFTFGNTGTNFTNARLTHQGLAILLNLGQYYDKFSEDCLTLNVWVPSGGEEGKAVMLLLYGGGWESGGASIVFLNGQYLADEGDIIVVTMNYRGNIFGFPSDPTGPANPGLLDQRLALEWVRDNIAAFGGDPKRITLFGYSEGGSSADLYSYQYLEDPIISAVVYQSGVNGILGPMANASGSWFQVASEVGCGNSLSDHASVTACMRTKDTATIKAALKDATFYPSVDNVTFFSNNTARDRAGELLKIPALIGSTNAEGSLFAVLDELKNTGPTPAQWVALGEQAISCPVAARANVSFANDIPTWRYLYFGNWTALELNDESGPWHISDVIQLFGSLLPSPAQSPEELAFGKYQRQAFTTFIKDPYNGLTAFGWPKYNPLEQTLVRLAYNNQVGTNLGMPAEYDVPCGDLYPVNAPLAGSSSSVLSLATSTVSASINSVLSSATNVVSASTTPATGSLAATVSASAIVSTDFSSGASSASTPTQSTCPYPVNGTAIVSGSGYTQSGVATSQTTQLGAATSSGVALGATSSLEASSTLGLASASGGPSGSGAISASGVTSPLSNPTGTASSPTTTRVVSSAIIISIPRMNLMAFFACVAAFSVSGIF